MPTEKPYPDPPWRMHGEAYFAPVAVPRSALALPTGFEVASPGPWTVGLFGFVRYLAPSPLVYDELIFMPAFVRAPAFGPRAKGWFVSVMYVSETHTLQGGNEIWKLPKTLARFDVDGGRCSVRADDGTALDFTFAKLGPGRRVRASISTLQANDGVSLCRFRGDSTATVSASRLRVDSFRSDAPAWGGFAPGRVSPLGACQTDFVSDMQVPTFIKK